MAESTKGTRRQNNITGFRRTVTWDSVTFANSGDTITVPGIKRIEDISMNPSTNASYGLTVSGNVITLTAGSGLTFNPVQITGI